MIHFWQYSYSILRHSTIAYHLEIQMKGITRLLIVLVLLDKREPVGATTNLVRYTTISRQYKQSNT